MNRVKTGEEKWLGWSCSFNLVFAPAAGMAIFAAALLAPISWFILNYCIQAGCASDKKAANAVGGRNDDNSSPG